MDFVPWADFDKMDRELLGERAFGLSRVKFITEDTDMPPVQLMPGMVKQSNMDGGSLER